MRHSHPQRLRNLTGIPGPIVAPGSLEWMQSMSASKVAAVVGLSPWMSRFALWHEMAGTIQRDIESSAMARGHYLEPAVGEWFASQHPESKVIPTGTWTHPEHPWATATPDRLVLTRKQHATLLEIKTASHSDEWGAAGTDEIPPGYRCQVVWSMFVTGARRAHLAVLLPFLELREYAVDYEAEEAEFLFQECASFMHDLKTETAPALDGSDSTYQAVRQLHPDIDGATVEIDVDTATAFIEEKLRLQLNVIAEQESRSLMLELMGSAKTATCNGVTIATRAAKGGGTPYLSYPRTLPLPGQLNPPEES